MTAYQIDGISGTGKTTLAAELIKRGYTAIDSDDVFAYFGNPETGEPTDEETQANWIWDLDKVQGVINSTDEVMFICGGALNQNKIKHIFDKRFMLFVDDDTLKERLLTRTNNDFGKHPDDLARQLKWNKSIVDEAKSAGSIVIDATKPVKDVADKILGIVRLG